MLLGEGGDGAGGAGSDSAEQDKDLPAQGEVTPLLCQGRRSHGARGMGWPGQWNIPGERRGREELSTGGYPSAPALLTHPPPGRPCRRQLKPSEGREWLPAGPRSSGHHGSQVGAASSGRPELVQVWVREPGRVGPLPR